VLSDDGVGMSREAMEKAFYPFFSTKGHGKAGLGLSVVYGVLKRHGAGIELSSHVGKGTDITVTFRAIDKSTNLVVSETFAEVPRMLQILVVDDDKPLLRVISELLSALGHFAVLAEDGLEALAKFEEGRFDLVITDLGLPGMSGWDVANAVKLRQDLPVILASGWGAQITDAEIKKHNVDYVLPKPFTMLHLKDALGAVMSRRATAVKT
jgi:CheY-like chemotaxis protein